MIVVLGSFVDYHNFRRSVAVNWCVGLWIAHHLYCYLVFLASILMINIISSLSSASNAETCLMMIHILCISQLSLVYVFVLVMYTKKKCPQAEIHAMGSVEYFFLKCKFSIMS